MTSKRLRFQPSSTPVTPCFRALHCVLLACALLCSACGAKTTAHLQAPASRDSQSSCQAPDTTPVVMLASLSETTASDASGATDDVWDTEWDDQPDADYADLEDDYATADTAQEKSRIADPLEPFNRVMFSINDKLYFWLLKPTATVYASVFPQQMRTGIYNVFDNLAFPIRFVSCLLQLKLERAAKEVGAFAMNTTFGIGGLVKISEHIEPLKDLSPEDLGQTLGHYGIGDGCYIVWPVFGPSTLRDTTGKIGEYFLNPVNYLDDWKIRWALKGEETINYSSLHLGDYEDLKEAAFDPYESLKDFYLQYRRHLSRQ